MYIFSQTGTAKGARGVSLSHNLPFVAIVLGQSLGNQSGISVWFYSIHIAVKSRSTRDRLCFSFGFTGVDLAYVT